MSVKIQNEHLQKMLNEVNPDELIELSLKK